MRSVLRAARKLTLCLPWRLLGASGLYHPTTPPVAFVVERNNWSIRWDGLSICGGITRLHPNVVSMTSRPERLYDRVVHFGSQFMWQIWYPHMTPRNRYVVTFFHGKPEDGPAVAANIDALLDNQDRIERFVTAAKMVEQRLIGWGIPKAKLIRIPIGVDSEHFRPPEPNERLAARRRFGVPEDSLCIGSFQKDGVGWGQGMIPKSIKGPDAFVDSVKILSRDFPIFVLLTGPARGYVRAALERHGIPYAHEFIEHYPDLRAAFHALDLYLVTSREEGGPKAILEGAATGVPVVSTKVGMAPDVIEDGVTGALVEIDDIEGMAARAGALLADAEARSAVAIAARSRIVAYDWTHISEDYYSKVYRPLL